RPGVVPGVVELLGQLRGEDPAGMPERIWDNYCRLMS
ncbi:MAG: hypothetical protein ACI85U_002558, partial [Candidatus Promineifilaceae bacterium]